MNCTKLQGQSRLDESTGTPRRGVPGSGVLCRARVAPIQRFCAVALAGLTLLVSLADTSHAQSGNTRKANSRAQAGALAPGIQDPMNPDAYMRDLASRMNSTSDQNLLLGGASAPRTGSTSAGPIVRGTPNVAPRVAPAQPVVGAVNRPASSVSSSPTVPALRILGGMPTTGPATPAVPSQPTGVVPNTFGARPAPAGQTASTASQPREVVPAASTTVPASSSQTPAATPGKVIMLPPTGFAAAPVAGAQAPAAASSQPSEPAPAASAPAPAPAFQTPAATPGRLIMLEPTGPAAARAPGSQSPVTTPGQLIQGAPSVLAEPSTPAPQTTLIMPGQAVPFEPVVSPVAVMGNSISPIYPTLNSTDSLFTQGPGAVERQLMAGRPGLTLWSEPGSANATAMGGTQATVPLEPEGPWTLGGDLEKYRAHAVKDGSRNSGENLKKALERTGMALGDGVNIFVLGYASDRAKPFRQNDGKGLFQEPGKVPAAAGATIGSLGVGLYSLADLLTLNALPDPNTAAYKDNNPLVRPVIFAGRTVHGVWKTTEEVGNAVTWGLFDNVTGCIGLVIEDVIEVVKHAGEAVTNVARAGPARPPGVGQQLRGDEGLRQHAGLQERLPREGRHRVRAGIRRLKLHRVPRRRRTARP
jgi:hypothetical protein